MSLFKSASTVSLLTLASRVTGLVRDLLMASMFGVSGLTDAFNVAFRIPNLLRRLFAEGAFSQAFVPVLARSREAQGEEKTKHLIDAVATALAWVLALVSVLGVVGALIAAGVVLIHPSPMALFICRIFCGGRILFGRFHGISIRRGFRFLDFLQVLFIDLKVFRKAGVRFIGYLLNFLSSK